MGAIVVGVDGSAASKGALRWALEEARLRNAQVVAVHAFEVPLPAPDVGPAPRLDVVALVTEVHERAAALVESVVDEVAGGAERVTQRVVEGPPVSALLEAARDAELLVVGSRGLGGFGGLLLGSVSQQAVQHAPCPVLVYR